MRSTKVLDTYRPQKIEIIRRLLERQAEKGTPMSYEISVDNFKVVMKSTDLSEFESYEDLVNKDTCSVCITLFETTANGETQTRYVFELPNKKSESDANLEKGLGEVEVNNRIKETISVERERWDKEQLSKELDATKHSLEEAEQYIEELENRLELLQLKPNHLGKLDLGSLAIVALEGVLRKNPQWLGKVPGFRGLAGVITKENESGAETKSSPTEDSEVSFTKSEAAAPALSENEVRCLHLGKRIAKLFDHEEMVRLVQIIEELGKDTSKLQTVADLLDIPKQEKETN
jgi:hypothetical protein